MRPASFSGLATLRVHAEDTPAASLEDDLRGGIGLEPRPEIVVEPLLGGGHDDEVKHVA